MRQDINSTNKLCSLIFLMILSAFTSADTVLIIDGSRLEGQVTTITPQTVTLETGFAGTITIHTASISQLTTDKPVSSRFEDGTVVTGIAGIDNEGVMTITSESTNMKVPLGTLLASWSPDTEPPEAAGYPVERDWEYMVGADITGRRGNSRENGTSIKGEAVLVGDRDELKFYLSFDRADTNGEETSNEVIFGTSYVNYFSEATGWYVSSELERDPFEGIELRATASGGISYLLWKRPDHNLELQAGLGYRHESFENGTNENSPTIDLGIEHMWEPTDWLNLTNSISFTPSITDLEDFLFAQDSGATMPIGSSRWSLRLGLRNNYKNEPAAGRKRLDTIYYSRLQLRFD